MKSKVSIFIVLTLILVFSAVLRMHSFYLPHNSGDQIFYLSLAMKLEQSGLAGYNLKGIDIISDGNILAVVNSRDPERGTLLEGLERGNVFYYSEQPLNNKPPAYSFLLMLSHKIFSPDKPYLSVDGNLGNQAIFLRPKVFLNSQFYAVGINFVFSLLFISIIFFLAQALFNERVGLWASLLMAVSPLNLLTSQRLWADDMLSVFCALSILLFLQGKKKANLFLILLSGISAGIAAITKEAGLFIIAVVFFSSIIIDFKEGLGKRSFFNILFDRYLIVFILTAVSLCAFWYIKITYIYGVPWYVPQQEGIEKVASWFNLLSKRSRFGQLYYFVYLSPPFILFYAEAIRTFSKGMFTKERITLLVWFCLFVFILIGLGKGGKEERYMLPAYPAIAIFAGVAIENIRVGLNKVRHRGDILIILLFFLTSLWSIAIGLDCVFANCAIFNLF